MHAEQLEGGRALTGAELSSPRAIWAWEGGGTFLVAILPLSLLPTQNT